MQGLLTIDVSHDRGTIALSLSTLPSMNRWVGAVFGLGYVGMIGVAALVLGLWGAGLDRVEVQIARLQSIDAEMQAVLERQIHADSKAAIAAARIDAARYGALEASKQAELTRLGELEATRLRLLPWLPAALVAWAWTVGAMALAVGWATRQEARVVVARHWIELDGERVDLADIAAVAMIGTRLRIARRDGPPLDSRALLLPTDAWDHLAAAIDLVGLDVDGSAAERDASERVRDGLRPLVQRVEASRG